MFAFGLKRCLHVIEIALAAGVQEFPNLGFDLVVLQRFIHRARPAIEHSLPVPKNAPAINLTLALDKHRSNFIRRTGVEHRRSISRAFLLFLLPLGISPKPLSGLLPKFIQHLRWPKSPTKLGPCNHPVLRAMLFGEVRQSLFLIHRIELNQCLNERIRNLTLRRRRSRSFSPTLFSHLQSFLRTITTPSGRSQQFRSAELTITSTSRTTRPPSATNTGRLGDSGDRMPVRDRRYA